MSRNTTPRLTRDEHLTRAIALLDQSMCTLRKITDQLETDEEEITKLDTALRSTGVCMSCVFGSPDPMGCTDCLGTGWDGGAPSGFVRQEVYDKVLAQFRECDDARRREGTDIRGSSVADVSGQPR